GWKLTFKVILPAISPYVFTGIRTSIPFAVIGAIVGEFVAATEGIGFFIRMSAGIFKTADVFVGIIVLMIMVIIIDRIAELIERRALRWQSQTEHIRIQAQRRSSDAKTKYFDHWNRRACFYARRRNYTGSASAAKGPARSLDADCAAQFSLC